MSQRWLLRRFRFTAKDAGLIRAARGFAGRRQRDRGFAPHVVRHGVDAEAERVGGRSGIGGKHAVIVFQRLGLAVIGRVQIDDIHETVRPGLFQIPDTVIGRLRVPIEVVAGFGAGEIFSVADQVPAAVRLPRDKHGRIVARVQHVPVGLRGGRLQL